MSVRAVVIEAVGVRKWCRSGTEWVSDALLRSSGVAENEASREMGKMMEYIHWISSLLHSAAPRREVPVGKASVKGLLQLSKYGGNPSAYIL